MKMKHFHGLYKVQRYREAGLHCIGKPEVLVFTSEHELQTYVAQYYEEVTEEDEKVFPTERRLYKDRNGWQFDLTQIECNLIRHVEA